MVGFLITILVAWVFCLPLVTAFFMNCLLICVFSNACYCVAAGCIILFRLNIVFVLLMFFSGGGGIDVLIASFCTLDVCLLFSFLGLWWLFPLPGFWLPFLLAEFRCCAIWYPTACTDAHWRLQSHGWDDGVKMGINYRQEHIKLPDPKVGFS